MKVKSCVSMLSVVRMKKGGSGEPPVMISDALSNSAIKSTWTSRSWDSFCSRQSR